MIIDFTKDKENYNGDQGAQGEVGDAKNASSFMEDQEGKSKIPQSRDFYGLKKEREEKKPILVTQAKKKLQDGLHSTIGSSTKDR